MRLGQVGKHILFGVEGIVLGGLVGLIAWLFMFIVNNSINFVWHFIPNTFNMELVYYPLIICSIGGVLVGLCQKYFGKYPRGMNDVLAEFKTTKRVEYHSIYKTALTALIVLTFGASLGPEAGLVGIVGALCTWVADRLWRDTKDREAFTESGIGAVIGIVFLSPLFGLFSLNKSEKVNRRVVPRIYKTIIYFITIFVGIRVYSFMSDFTNNPSFIVKFGEANIDKREILAFIPLVIIGILFALIYIYIGKILGKIMGKLDNKKVIKAIIGGLVLGIVTTFLPYTLFSGEHQLRELIVEWEHLPIYLLLLTCIFKMFITQFCLKSGWRGGHIYPIIFAGACLGYALSSSLGLDPVAAACMVIVPLTAFVLKKPLAVTLLFFAFFPINLWVVVVLAVLVATLPDIISKRLKPAQAVKQADQQSAESESIQADSQLEVDYITEEISEELISSLHTSDLQTEVDEDIASDIHSQDVETVAAQEDEL